MTARTCKSNITGVQQQLVNIMNIIHCTTCREVLSDPRMLPCFHAFCLNCVSFSCEQANKGSGDRLPCPACRKEFTIPPSGVEGLQKNAFIQRMIDTRKLLERTSEQIPCDTCNDESNGESMAFAITASHCVECNLNLCGLCCAHHRRSRLTREHTLREGASQTNTRESDEDKMCLKHTVEEKKLYCKSCSDLLCPLCFIESHQGHERSSVIEAGDNFRRQIEARVNDISECTLKATIKKELIEVEMDRIAKVTERLEKEVIKRRDDLKKLIDTHAEFLLKQIRTRKLDKLNEISVHNDETEAHLASLEGYKDYSSSSVIYGTNSELCKTISDLNTRATELRKENDAVVQRPLAPYQSSFTATTLDKFFNLIENIIGKIKDSGREERELTSKKHENTTLGASTTNSEEILPQPERLVKEHETDSIVEKTEQCTTNEIGNTKRNNETEKEALGPKAALVQEMKTKQTGRPIWGLTIMLRELFIIKGASSAVEVYDSASYKFKREWVVTGLTDPQDIVSCASKKCLLVMNWNDGCNPTMILKVDGNGKVLGSWSMKISGGLLSITLDSTVVVTDYGRNKLYEYSLDWELILEMELSAVILRHPQHAVKLTNGHFLVCSGGPNDLLHSVCLLDAGGKILKSFGREKGSDNHSLKRPLHLAVGLDGCILVADWNNRRVLLLNSDLQFQTELVTRKSGLKHPGRIFIDSSNNQLLIANNAHGSGTGHVLICQLFQ